MFYVYNKEKCSLIFTTDNLENLDGVLVVKNCIVTKIPFSYPIEKNGEIVEATKIDLYNKGLYVLQAGELVLNDEIIYIQEPSNEYVKNYWNGSIWTEGATQEEFILEREIIEKKIVEVKKEIQIREEMNLSLDNENTKMLELHNKLNYVKSKIK